MVTVPSLVDETPLDQYTATASQTDFNFTYMIFATEDIKVYVNGVLKTETTDYVVKQSDGSAIVPADDLPMDGGKVVFNSGLTSGDKVSLSRDIAIERLTGYSVAGAFRADVVNAEFTKIYAIQQQLERDISRTLRLSASDAEGGSLALPTNRASKFLAFDANGDMIASEGSADNIVVSSYMATVLDDTTAAAARTTLGVSSYTQTIDNFISSSDQTPATGDLNQIGKGVAAYVGQAGIYTTDSGVADAYVVTQVSPFKAPHKLFAGLTIRFRTSNTNTGACTVNAFTLGVKNIKLDDGSTDPAAGDISTTKENVAVYDGTVFRLKNAASDAAGFRLGSIQTFSSSGTWNKPSGLKKALIQLVGGGGSGASTLTVNAVGGAGAGGFAQSFIDAGNLGSSETVTIGAGGAGVVSNNNGNTGGTTSFGSHLSATGGQGGLQGSGFGGLGGTGTVVTGTGYTAQGQSGGTGMRGSGAGGNGDASGSGGNSFFAGGGRGGSGSNTGSAGDKGSGAGSTMNGGTSAVGGNGFVVVYEYF